MILRSSQWYPSNVGLGYISNISYDDDVPNMKNGIYGTYKSFFANTSEIVLWWNWKSNGNELKVTPWSVEPYKNISCGKFPE